MKEKDGERDDGRKSKHNHRDDDRYKHLSIDVTLDQLSADLDFKNHNESYKIFHRYKRQ